MISGALGTAWTSQVVHRGLDFAGRKIACRFRPISELLGARAGASVFPMAAWVPTAGEQSAKSEGVHDVCRAM